MNNERANNIAHILAMNRINEIVNNTFNILANKIINEIANNMVVRAMVHGDNNNKQWQSQAQMVVCFIGNANRSGGNLFEPKSHEIAS